MKKVKTNAKKGFTIIEVVLVLAIAGLIFLMVFVALPNLQRTQRDTQRRNDVDRVQTSLIQYVTNNNQVPSGGSDAFEITPDMGVDENHVWRKFARNYLAADGDTFEDPNGSPYYMQTIACTSESCVSNLLDAKFGDASYAVGEGEGATTTEIDGGIIVVAANAQCGAEVENNAFEYTSGKRSFAVAMRLEGNGVYCVDNH